MTFDLLKLAANKTSSYFHPDDPRPVSFKNVFNFKCRVCGAVSRQKKERVTNRQGFRAHCPSCGSTFLDPVTQEAKDRIGLGQNAHTGTLGPEDFQTPEPVQPKRPKPYLSAEDEAFFGVFEGNA